MQTLLIQALGLGRSSKQVDGHGVMHLCNNADCSGLARNGLLDCWVLMETTCPMGVDGTHRRTLIVCSLTGYQAHLTIATPALADQQLLANQRQLLDGSRYCKQKVYYTPPDAIHY
jgi:hypothetical protein